MYLLILCGESADGYNPSVLSATTYEYQYFCGVGPPCPTDINTWLDFVLRSVLACSLGGTMGLAFSRLWERMFGKKEMRILMVSEKGSEAGGMTKSAVLLASSYFCVFVLEP